MPAPVEITLLGKPGCHLCDDARAVVNHVLTDTTSRGIETVFVELNILEEPELARLYSEDIPVIRVAGKRHAIWHVDPVKLTTAIEKAARRPGWLRRPEFWQFRPENNEQQGEENDTASRR